jgi:hypothetical protein
MESAPRVTENKTVDVWQKRFDDLGISNTVVGDVMVRMDIEG